MKVKRLSLILIVGFLSTYFNKLIMIAMLLSHYRHIFSIAKNPFFIWLCTSIIISSVLRSDEFYPQQFSSIILIILLHHTLYSLTSIEIIEKYRYYLLLLVILSHSLEYYSDPEHINLNCFDILFIVAFRKNLHAIILLMAVFLLSGLLSGRSSNLIVVVLLIVFKLSILRKIIYFSIVFACAFSPLFYNAIIHSQLIEFLSIFESNLIIRLHFVIAAIANMEIGNYIYGMGYNIPYRDVTYQFYNHPLIYDDLASNTVSSHNSFFDLFYRLGIFGCVLFYVKYIRSIQFLIKDEPIVLLVFMFFCYSCFFNAALDYSKYILFSAVSLRIFDISFWKYDNDR
jgi:hypothetical protein